MTQPSFVIRPDGSIETDSLSEAIRIAKAMRSASVNLVAVSPASVDNGVHVSASANSAVQRGNTVSRLKRPRKIRQLIEALRRVAEETEIDSVELAKSLGMRGGRGLAGLSKAAGPHLEPHNMVFRKDVIRLRRHRDGTTTWSQGPRFHEAFKILANVREQA